jgi:NADPH-dependent 2,4-dienoyl-CoA reductase/sulfur reductase-like enzyme
VVVLGLGARPRVGLALDAGIPVGPAGGIVVDDRMHTPVDGVWAAGDCVESLHRVSGRPAVVALGTHANRQGRVVGSNVTGADDTFPGVLGTAITRFGDLEIGRTGLTLAEADRLGIPATGTTTTTSSLPHYMPGATPVQVLVVADPSDGRLLGAQIVGGAGSAKRIDVFATALWNQMTVHELADVDLSYAPPFSPVYDPVAMAAGRASVELRRHG